MSKSISLYEKIILLVLSFHINLPNFHFHLFISKVRIHIHCHRHFRMPHQVLQRFWIHPCSSHIGAIGMPAHMWRDFWQLHLMCSIVFPHYMLKILLPMPCYFRHSILIQEQKSNFVINHRFYFRTSSRLQYTL